MIVLAYVFAGAVGLLLGRALHRAFLRAMLRRMIVRRIAQVSRDIAESTRVEVLTRKVTELEQQKGELMRKVRQLERHVREFQSLEGAVRGAAQGSRAMIPCPDCGGKRRRVVIRTMGEDDYPYYEGEPCPTCRGGNGYLTVRFD